MQSTHFCDLYKASQKGYLLYATFHSYKQVTEAQTSCILPYLPSLKDTERAELFCDGSQIDGEKHSPINRKPHQVYNRESGDGYTSSSPGTDWVSQIGHPWPSHITVLQIAWELSFTAFHTSQQAPTLDLMILNLVYRQSEVRNCQLLLLSNNCMVNAVNTVLTTQQIQNRLSCTSFSTLSNYSSLETQKQTLLAIFSLYLPHSSSPDMIKNSEYNRYIPMFLPTIGRKLHFLQTWRDT